MELSPLYKYIEEKYKNDKIMKHIYSLIATTMSSEFEYIDPEPDVEDGMKIQVVPELIMEEILLYITMI